MQFWSRRRRMSASAATFLVGLAAASVLPHAAEARGLAGRVLRTASPSERLVGNPLESIVDKLNKTVHSANRVVESAGDVGKKRLMSEINAFRIMMCYQRRDLLRHTDCMKFMVDKCSDQTSGKGLCEKLFAFLIKHCQHGDKDACHYAEVLDLTVPEAENDMDEAEVDKELIDEMQKVTEDVNETTPEVVIVVNKTEGTNFTVPAPASAPAPALVLAPAPAPGPAPDTGISKEVKKEGLPEQGYNEFGGNDTVNHKDNHTQTSDWLDEIPDSAEYAAKAEACKKTPDTVWCKLFLTRHEAINAVPEKKEESWW